MKLALALSCFSLAATAVATASKVALVIGGFGATDSVQVVDQDGGACQGFDSTPGVPRAPDGRIGWVAQHVNGKVVLCGGAKTDFYKDCFEMPMGQGWSPASSMTYAKRYADSLVFNGEMVVLGGYNQNQGWLDAVEKRNGQGQWEEMEAWKMPRKIFDLCAVQMDQDKIMVLGGNILGQFDSTDMDILDTKTNTWSKGPAMAKPRATHDCIVTEYNGEEGVMVTGGCSQNCQFHLKDTSFFSFVTQTWTELPPMNVGRMGHKMILLGGKPTVIGGFDYSELNSIEEFDGTQWVMRSDKLPFASYVFGSPDNIPDELTCQ